jgi:hypothetical protein
MAFLLVVQAVRELQQLLEQFLDAAAAGVVAFDQRLELLGEVGAGAVQRIIFSSWARIAALSTSRSVFLCFDSLKRCASASKLIFDRSSAGGA